MQMILFNLVPPTFVTKIVAAHCAAIRSHVSSKEYFLLVTSLIENYLMSIELRPAKSSGFGLSHVNFIPSAFDVTDALGKRFCLYLLDFPSMM